MFSKKPEFMKRLRKVHSFYLNFLLLLLLDLFFFFFFSLQALIQETQTEINELKEGLEAIQKGLENFEENSGEAFVDVFRISFHLFIPSCHISVSLVFVKAPLCFP